MAGKPWMVVAIVVLALLLPLFGVSLIALLVIDRFVSRADRPLTSSQN